MLPKMDSPASEMDSEMELPPDLDDCPEMALPASLQSESDADAHDEGQLQSIRTCVRITDLNIPHLPNPTKAPTQST